MQQVADNQKRENNFAKTLTKSWKYARSSQFERGIVATLDFRAGEQDATSETYHHSPCTHHLLSPCQRRAIFFTLGSIKSPSHQSRFAHAAGRHVILLHR
mmetsp:Transcript_13650/g.21583  ORF Transcript_13650/g.21583 Transcript_13650/m.21583 type:complete len:100 (+) Transcript_13650:775-1074(+)